MADVIAVIHSMVDDGLLAETRNASGRVEIRFPRLALKMDAPPKAAVGGPRLTPIPGLKLVYQVDEVRQGTAPIDVAAIAESVLASPASRHRVYHDKSWKDATAVPEIAAFLPPPEDEIPDDIPPDI